jgi:hypothetical protein
MPPKYGGSKEDLAGWLVQMNVYILYYTECFGNEASKVGFATSCLEGKALKWFEPTLKDFLKNPNQDD